MPSGLLSSHRVLSKASRPIYVTLDGMSILVKATQLKNAHSPIYVTLPGIVISERVT